jgi:hypothetical protein
MKLMTFLPQTPVFCTVSQLSFFIISKEREKETLDMRENVTLWGN